MESFISTISERIKDKVDMYSISKDDVGDSFNELAVLAMLFPVATLSWTYEKDQMVRDASYNLFISLQDDVSGDTTNGANWQLVSSVAGNKQVFAMGATELANAYTSTDGTVSAYSTSSIYIVTPDTPNSSVSPTWKINALADLALKKFTSGAYVDLAVGDFDGTMIVVYKTLPSPFWLVINPPVSGGGTGNTSTQTQTITCDGINTDYTVTNPLNNPDAQVTVRYDNASPYTIVRPDIIISAGNAVVNLSPYLIDIGISYKVIFTGEQL